MRELLEKGCGKMDYYPFGMAMPGRKYTGGSDYRYGFNGKEKDKDISEGGQDYGMRIYDTRIGKFLSVDPLMKKYPDLTTYQFASNRPIEGIDLDGLEFMKANTASFVLAKEAYKSTAFVGEIYHRPELIIRVESVYEISEKHIEDAEKFADHFLPEEPESPKEYERGLPGLRKSTFLDNKVGNMFKIVGEIKTLRSMLDVYTNSWDAKYDPKTKANIDKANLTWKGLGDAQSTVIKAVQNRTFPDKLNTKQIVTDLINYVTDHTLPSNSFIDPYSRIISQWGDLIFKHKDEVKTFDFSPLHVVIERHDLTLSGQTVKTITTTKEVGNPDKEVNDANELIKDKVPKPQPTISSGN